MWDVYCAADILLQPIYQPLPESHMWHLQDNPLVLVMETFHGLQECNPPLPLENLWRAKNHFITYIKIMPIIV